ncbi:leucine-rich repeat-containing protein 40-like isoform X2 [Thrips palmi]|uniref:Leucine-rich repeat-containing protein 40-like isoform X2 n=1 Tax=Thrips palmi TaxID=161013 RepID=A0A6P8Y5U3_THRPL|nr:leucine-rich repeat-containing protein 40-like isoform X2 [Thrips palmi]
MANAVTRVVLRCQDAADTGALDLSECQLVQVPDAVYHLMRHTALTTCNLSGNVITKLPPKFAVKFSLITELNVSHNQMSKLPDELCDLAELHSLDISHNAFITLPRVAFKMPKLANLTANHNRIIEVEVERLREAPSLVEVDLTDNPVLPEVRDALKAVEAPRVLLSERQKEDWEDLTV